MELSLAATSWPRVPDRATVLVPVGSTEQHGPHLPISTDTDIATTVASAAATRLRVLRMNVLVAPAISYGSSGEHQGFAGTSSIGTSALGQVLIELTRSMSTWADHVFFVNAHGGNIDALRSATTQLKGEGHDVDWVACATETVDLHAGRTETSLMLHIAPWDVRLHRAEVGNTASLRELLPVMRTSGIRAVSPNGVLGDPRGASAEEGKRILDSMVAEVADFVLERHPVVAP